MTKYFEARIVKLQKLLKQLNLDGMIVYQGANMKYLTGFSGGTGDGVVIIGRDSACLVTDARYEEAYKASLPESVNLKITRAYYEEAVSVAVSFDIKNWLLKPICHITFMIILMSYCPLIYHLMRYHLLLKPYVK